MYNQYEYFSRVKEVFHGRYLRELYYQFVISRKDACPERTPAVGNLLPRCSPDLIDAKTSTGLQRLPHGLSGRVSSRCPSGTGLLLLKICNCEGHQLLLAGLLQGGHRSTGGPPPAQIRCARPGVSEVLIPLLIECFEYDLHIPSLYHPTYTHFSHMD